MDDWALACDGVLDGPLGGLLESTSDPVDVGATDCCCDDSAAGKATEPAADARPEGFDDDVASRDDMANSKATAIWLITCVLVGLPAKP